MAKIVRHDRDYDADPFANEVACKRCGDFSHAYEEYIRCECPQETFVDPSDHEPACEHYAPYPCVP